MKPRASAEKTRGHYSQVLIVGDGAMSAASALIEMSAEHGSAPPRNGQKHFDKLPANPLTASFDESVSRSTDEIGHF